ncbi:hypothetical protein [Bradyrhizobium cajani]|uniref:Uncharacterized protein n=1 Tax=Bradyrhizobium cajani TaxID=1928661 RepID=A0A844SY98_9BRAD|nr:hypothetical protein [Bradyrhizobium cajani]MCP3369499.1 hypothetical protein [Bradyrhizobium cajani]MVT71908.1 hypothetical protein [Bradyrhizobium cajani]
MSVLTKTAGADIRRGDMVKVVKGKLFPALLYERYDGGAAEDIPEGACAYCLNDKVWRAMPPDAAPPKAH